MALIPPPFIDCVVAIGTEVDGQKKWVGTGFLFGDLIRKDEEGKRQYRVYLVSNKHVLENLEVAKIRFNPQTDQAATDYDAQLKDKDGKQLWTGHPDKDVDVGAIEVNFQLIQKEGMKCSFFQSDGQTASIQDLKDDEITEGDFVYVLGFPMGLVSEDRQHVFVRGGVISRIRDLYENRGKDFVVDAPVFPGNSGGPVFSKPEIVSITGTKACNKARLIGIVKSYIPYIDVAISQQTKRARITFEENSGLSKVQPVDHILETIAEIKNKP